jgi:hypothetical protein
MEGISLCRKYNSTLNKFCRVKNKHNSVWWGEFCVMEVLLHGYYQIMMFVTSHIDLDLS